MKKIILILLIPLFLTSCYDYKEMEELVYINGFGLDYVDNEFILYYEVLNYKKESDTIKKESEVLKGKGKTIMEANENINNFIDKTSFYSHAKILLVSEEFAKNHFEETSDFLLRNIRIYNEFLIAITDKNNVEDILKVKDPLEPIATDVIYNLLTSNIYTKNYAIDYPYSDIINNMHSKYKDTPISIINLRDNKIVLEGMAYYQNYNLVNKSNIENANLYDVLNDPQKNIPIKLSLKDSYVELQVYFEKTDIEVNDKEIKISINSESEIKSDVAKLNLKNSDDFKTIENTLNDELKNKINKFVKELQFFNSDLLGFEKKYYEKYRKDNDNKWLSANIKINIESKIIKKGIIYDTNESK